MVGGDLLALRVDGELPGARAQPFCGAFDAISQDLADALSSSDLSGQLYQRVSIALADLHSGISGADDLVFVALHGEGDGAGDGDGVHALRVAQVVDEAVRAGETRVSYSGLCDRVALPGTAFICPPQAMGHSQQPYFRSCPAMTGSPLMRPGRGKSAGAEPVQFLMGVSPIRALPSGKKQVP